MIELWRPEYEAGAIGVVRAVFDEYGFTWDEADYHADLYDVPLHYAAKGHPFFVAVNDGAVVGTVALDIFDLLLGEPGETVVIDDRVRIAATDCALERLYVHPDARRQGIGHALIARVLEEATRRRRTAMEIWSDKRFRDAHRLYQRLGATVIGERICHDPDKSPEWGLRRALG